MKETTKEVLYYLLMTAIIGGLALLGRYVVLDHYYSMMKSGKIAVSYVMANYNQLRSITAIIMVVYSILAAGVILFVEKLLTKLLFELD